MCLAIPGRVVEIVERHGQPVAVVDLGGTRTEVALALLPEVVVGDHVIAHAGVAIQRLDEQAAAESLALFRELGRLDERSE